MENQNIKRQITSEEWRTTLLASSTKSIFPVFIFGILFIEIKPMSFMGAWQYLIGLVILVIVFLVCFVYFIFKNTSNKRIFEPS